MFVVGDTDKVLTMSRPLNFNPFRGYARKERDVRDRRVREQIKDLAQLEGARADAHQPVTDLGGQRTSHVVARWAAVAPEPGTGRIDQLERRLGADIGTDERLLHLVPRGVVGGRAGAEDGAEAAAEA